MAQEAPGEQAGPADAGRGAGSEQRSPSGGTEGLRADNSGHEAARSSEAAGVQAEEEPKVEQPVESAGDPKAPIDLMPSIKLLLAHIQHHTAGGPGCNPELAGTFTPLVSMACQLNLQAQAAAAPHAATAQAQAAALAALSLQGHVPGLQGGDAAVQACLAGLPGLGAAAAAAAGLPAFDPSVLAASAADPSQVAAAAAAAAAATGQPAEQQQDGATPARTPPASASARKGGGRRRQGSRGGAGQEGDHKGRQEKRSAAARQGGASQRPQRERKRSRLLEEYVDEEGLDAAGLGGG